MGQSVIRNPRKIHSQSGGDPSLHSRVTILENNEYKVTYYEIISGASGSVTLPTGATINAGEFGLSGNCILSKIDGSNKPTFESPKTSGGTIVTASLNETTGAWVASGVYTDPSVALIYSIKIKAINYSNLTYANIIETTDDTGNYVKKGTLTNNTILKGSGTDTATDSSITDDGTTVTVNSPAIITSDAGNNQIISIDNLKALVAHDVKILFNSPIYSFANMQANETVETDASKNLVSVAKATGYNLPLGTTAGTVLEGDRITQTVTNGVTDKVPSEDAVFDALGLKLTAANNLSDLASNKTARVNLGLDKGTNGGNAAYNILLTDKTVYTGTAFTAPRVWTLPDASTVNPFYEILVIDSLQTITSTNTLTIGVQSGQYLNGVLNGTEVIQSAGGWRRLISNGTNNWTFDAGVVRISKAQTISNKTLDSTNTAITQTSGDNSTKIATTAYVDAASPPAAKLFNYYNFS